MAKSSLPEYKAWDKKRNKMMRVLSVSFEEQYVVCKKEPQNIPLADVELLRYIGRSSIDKKRICEGDIVTFKDGYNVEIAVVVRVENEGWFYQTYGTDKKVASWDLKDVEVCGNKFENPDFLSDKQLRFLKWNHIRVVLTDRDVGTEKYCKHDLKDAIEKLSSLNKEELIGLIESLADDVRYYKQE